MYQLFKDALIIPHNLLKYRNKGFFFTATYVLILAFLMSLGTIVQMLSFVGNSELTSENVGCRFDNGALFCDGADYDPNREFALFGYAVYFLESGELLLDPQASRIVFQGDSFSLYLDGNRVYGVNLMIPADNSLSFDQYMKTVVNVIRYGSGVYALISNVLILLGIALIATLSFLRLARFIRYKTIYKLVLFGLTGFAVVMTFYNLLHFHVILFYVLMFVSYRGVFLLQQVLTRETMIHLNEMAMRQSGSSGETVETQRPEAVETEETEEADPHSETEEDDSSDSD
jgi:hypothetical protein